MPLTRDCCETGIKSLLLHCSEYTLYQIANYNEMGLKAVSDRYPSASLTSSFSFYFAIRYKFVNSAWKIVVEGER
jgi:hypothetical protein